MTTCLCSHVLVLLLVHETTTTRPPLMPGRRPLRLVFHYLYHRRRTSSSGPRGQPRIAVPLSATHLCAISTRARTARRSTGSVVV